MEERKIPPVQRGNIDGIRPRKPAVGSPQTGSDQAASEQNLKNQPRQENPSPKATVGKKPKPAKNWLAVTLAVIIFLGLSSFAFYTGLQKSDSGDSGSPTDSTSDSKQLIDQTINDIDQLNYQPDTSGDGLSDEQLGL